MKNTYNTHIIIPETVNIVNLLPEANISNYQTEDHATNFSNNNVGKSFPTSSVNYPGVGCTTSSSDAETRYTYVNNVPFINGHTYYLRWTTIGTNPAIRYDCYWPLKEPSICDYRIATVKRIHTYLGTIVTAFSSSDKMPCVYSSQYQMNTEIFIRTDTADGDYTLRFDFDNYRNAINVNFSCPMLIDLTETYTNNGLALPNILELNNKEYFSGTIRLIDWV